MDYHIEKMTNYQHYWHKPIRCACRSKAVICIENENTIWIECKRKCGVWTGYIHYSKEKPINSEIFANDMWERAVIRRKEGIE